MKFLAVCVLLLLAVHAAAAANAFFPARAVEQHVRRVRAEMQRMMASVPELQQRLQLHSLKDDSCSLSMPSTDSVSLDTLLAASTAKAACKAAKFSAYDQAQATLNFSRVETAGAGSVCDSAAKSQKQSAKQPYTCAKTITYPNPTTAKATFNTSVTTNAQPGHVIAVSSNVHIVMPMTVSLLGMTNSTLTDETDTYIGELAAMADVCDSEDAAALVAAIATYMNGLSAQVNSVISCMKLLYSAFGGSLDASVTITLSQTIYTQVDPNTWAGVESSKVTGQGDAKGAAAGLVAPAHVWLLTAAAAAMVFGKMF